MEKKQTNPSLVCIGSKKHSSARITEEDPDYHIFRMDAESFARGMQVNDVENVGSEILWVLFAGDYAVLC